MEVNTHKNVTEITIDSAAMDDTYHIIARENGHTITVKNLTVPDSCTIEAATFDERAFPDVKTYKEHDWLTLIGDLIELDYLD